MSRTPTTDAFRPTSGITRIDTPADIASMKGALLKDIQRSAYVYRVDCGGCNGCEIEIFAAITPIFDAERFGIKVVASPRHADILLFTGAVTRAMRMPAVRAYEAAPDPKIVVSYGACGCSGGIFHDLYCVWGGTDKIVPVDVYIPGCPPTPAATIYGFAVALGLLGQKLKAETHVEGADERVAIAHPNVPYNLRVLIEREARRMAGYRQGGDIAELFLTLLGTAGTGTLSERMARHAGLENDPRTLEILERLKGVVTAAMAGAAS
ncbi:NADH-quinone oxidoreductase subunit NuoB [Siculibacillus lacustris]|uniref:NADH-quinone oxidoreductase subunit NuoB n=1 Tax=Siculibacillus lacustris TaxID=1549641 RepID=A0A4Q9VYN5_9HYPH|nr:NADH-quinone oxidoreductase subunit B family protein [Siculibacillus lacustris]TBW40323.1 NADH-quinone oxidoreductase subunit NuoB [Siculibacillus lacustris]